MNLNKYIYTIMGSTVSSACICNVCNLSQPVFWILLFVLAGAGAGAQAAADRRQKRQEAEAAKELEEAKQNRKAVTEQLMACMREGADGICEKIEETKADSFFRLEKCFQEVCRQLKEEHEKICGLCLELEENFSRNQEEVCRKLETEGKQIGKKLEENGSGVVKEIHALAGDMVRETAGFTEECKILEEKLDRITENQNREITAEAETHKAVSLMSEHMENNMEEMKLGIAEQTNRCDRLLMSSKEHSKQNDKGISILEDMMSKLPAYKEEICRRIEMCEEAAGKVADLAETVEKLEETVAEIKESHSGISESVTVEICSLKEDVLEQMQKNTAGQDRVVDRYDALTGRINNLIVELGKEADDVVRALKDFYQMVNLTNVKNRSSK